MENNAQPQPPEHKVPAFTNEPQPLPHPKTEEEIRTEAQIAEGGAKIGADRSKH